MKKNSRIFLKLILIFLLLIGLLYLMKRDTELFRMEQPKGAGVKVRDAEILMQAFYEKAACSEEAHRQLGEWLGQIQEQYRGREEELFLYGDYIKAMELLSWQEQFAMKKKYKEEFYLLKEDWYEGYEKLLSFYGLQEEIKETEVFILSGNENLIGEKTGEHCILLAGGETRTYRSPEFADCFFSQIKAYADGDTLLTVLEKQKEEVTLKNVWLMEADEKGIQFFIHGFEMNYDWREEPPKEAQRESVADLTFAEGELKKIEEKTERINGKLLRMEEGELELQDKGTFQIAEECKVYRLYEEFLETEISDLRIGYDFADYVIDKGKICAVLIMRKENMENIRVAVMNSHFKSLYHDEILLAADCDLEVIYGPYEKRERTVIPAGEEIRIDGDSDFLQGDRIELIPSAKSGRIQAISIERNQGIPSYRGSMEIVRTEDGLALVNELLLEEYLYSVVPSEMPASYGPAALKAQAVCARTYAYRYLIHPGLSEIGAHVDDSVNYQVYNNIAENVNATKAVRETTGILLYYGDEAVSTYYYSTSCGFGTDAGIWNEENREIFPYLTSLHIAKTNGEGEEDEDMAGKMQQEEVFREYIINMHEEDYEREEAWYRWTYTVEEIDIEKMAERLQEEFHDIYEITIAERREGGAAHKLILETDTGIFEVTGEYDIRYILNNGGSVRKQDGTETENGKLLPSAYMVIDVVKEQGNVIGYTIFGGGYGHGVGMSQNGAKVMGNRGKNCEEILSFFYPDCYMKKMY